ncbi:Scr1 family TA system antitoxin-like transcriptional regulator [Streptomyces sp. NPDC051561]|uniref:helix-turn-helix domain-containing protein n=1 Tax=Streptomyces sp. NPDC051561 TaxID=3365658 RepID=UPI0037B854A1
MTRDQSDEYPIIWTVFGLQQASLRERRGMSQAALALAAGYSESLVQKIEAGKQKPQPEYVQAIDNALEADGVLVAITSKLKVLRYPHFFQRYADTEKLVKRLYAYDALSINGLLQTEAHARAVLSARIPLLGDEEIEANIEGRLDRQSLLGRKPPPTLVFVIEEHVVRRPIGGREVHRSQLLHIAECGRTRNVSIHVMPTDVETHVGLDGFMTLLDTAEDQSLAYVEWQGGGSAFYTTAKEVNALDQRYAMIRSQALRAPESLAFIEKLAGEL